MSESMAVGIDLGTTFSSIAYLKNKSVKIISNNESSYFTQSTVHFGNSDIRVGDDSVDIHDFNPRNFVFSAKRLIGRHFDSQEVRQVCNSLGQNYYTVINNDGRPGINVSFNGGSRIIEPEVISALVLKEMARLGTNSLGEKIKIKAVITVPAYFNDSQRQGTIDAARLAGLDVLRIVNEPTAAAIAYANENLTDSKEKANMLVFDLGGGTLDITILTVDNNNYTVLATGGNTHLGGDDFDDILVNHFLGQMRNNPKLRPHVGDSFFIARLRNCCKRLKKSLSTKEEVNTPVEIAPGLSFPLTMTRAQYENMCHSLFDSIINTVQEVLNNSGFEANDIKHIVLAGGSSRMPLISRSLKNMFPNRIRQDINPEEAVVSGAAYLAAQLNDQLPVDMPPFTLNDVTSLTVGFEDAQDKMHPVIKRYTRLPAENTIVVSNSYSGQKRVEIPIYQGEDPIARNNHLLQKFVFDGITPGPEGTARIYITFTIDRNGVLNVSANDLQTGQRHELRVLSWVRTYSVEENGPNRDLWNLAIAS